MSDQPLAREKNVIDILKIENLKEVYDGWQGACPVCRQIENRDTAGDNLKVWRNGRFNCIADSYHNSSILSLVGTKADGIMSHYFTPSEIKHEVEIVYPESILFKLVRNFDYWKSRGVSHETMAQFEGGIAIDGKMKGRYVFPVRNIKNQIIGFSGRWIGEKKDNIPKWKHISKISKGIFPLKKNSSSKIILIESISDCVSLWNNGITNTLVMFGVKLSSPLLSHIISLNPSHIIISTNNDLNMVGNNAAVQILATLKLYFNEDQMSIIHPKSNDWGEEKDMNIFNLLR